MTCSCDATTVAFSIPADLEAAAPFDADAATICTRCLDVSPADGPAGDREPDFTAVSDAFPGGEAGAAFALALGLLESLATNRAAIERALDHAERAGADPLLALDRLVADPSVEPAIDLERRRTQVESLLY